MRVVSSIKNATIGILQTLISVVLGFFARAVFLQVLGVEYQGLNSLFMSIISVLSFAELGLGVAITFNMYPAIAENNTELIKSWVNFFRKCYYVIATIVFVLGVLLMPFLHLFADASEISSNLYLVFGLFLLDAVFSYLFSYKRTILFANQKNYIVSLADLLYSLVLNVVQITSLLIFGDFLLFLIIRVSFRLVENGIINLVANKMFPYITEKNVVKLDKQSMKEFFKQMYGMLFHRIGGVFVLWIDGILISAFLGLAVLGLYSNYLLLFTAVAGILGQIINGVVASIGDLLTEKDSEKSFKVYKRLSLLNFWLYALAFIGLYLVAEPFIRLWLSDEFLLPNYILLLMSLNFYFQGMRGSVSSFKTAAGIFYEDRYVPLVEAIIKIIMSLILVQFMGLAGILLGTLISKIVLFGYSYPKFVYKPLFKRKMRNYYMEQIGYLSLLFIIFVLVTRILSVLGSDSVLLVLIINSLITLIVTNAICWLIFKKKEEFQYFKDMFLKLIIKK